MASTIHPTPMTCPISAAPAAQLPPMGARREIISPSVGGRYAISDTTEILLRHQPLDDRERALLASWVADQRRGGAECPLITSYVLHAVIGRGG
jgi:hypothetical protein